MLSGKGIAAGEMIEKEKRKTIELINPMQWLHLGMIKTNHYYESKTSDSII